MSSAHLYHALTALKDATNGIIKEAQAEKVGGIIQTRAIVSAAAGVGAAIFPGIGGLAAASIAVGAVWEMYIQINRQLGISISKNTLKSLASAILSNILSSAGGALLAVVAVGVLNFIPGLNILIAPAQAIIAYIAVFAAGILYLKLLTKLFKAKGTFDMSGVNTENAAKEVINESNINSMIKDLKQSYNDDKEEIKRRKKDNKN